MHNLFLGELHHHCRTVWKLDSVGSGSGGRAKPGSSHTPSEQRAHLNRIYSALKNRSENALAEVRKDYLSAVARFNQVVGFTSTDPTKRDYAKALLQWVKQNHDLTAFRLPPVLEESVMRFRLPFDEPPKEVSRFLVFTREVLEQVRQDIESTTLPSWIEKAPSNFGSAGQGKLKADHWRTVCTINMVITLVRLWGTARSSFEEIEALKNFLHLIIAVDLATRRSTNPIRAATYEHHMHQYLRGLRSLYQSPLVPNHHLSLHLRPLLEAFGPVHGWWAFAFERYNGLLQRMKTNFKPAEMPKTFMRYFYMGGALRWLMRVTPWPKSPEFDDMLNSFEEAFSDRVRGTRITQMLSFGQPSADNDFEYDHRRETSLSSHVYDTLFALINSTSPCQFQSSHGTAMDGRPRLHSSGQFVDTIHHGGIRFATSDAGVRDAFILYRHSNTVKAGQISSIFYHQRMGPDGLVIEPFFVINPYAPLVAKDADSDPYRCFPELETKLYYNWQESRQDVVEVGAIVSHFAAFVYTPEEIGQPCIVARSLDRVGRSQLFKRRTY
ncbi:hypothetical protein LXA43DRAFT_899280 [Ganoderma leucocontextum]|nr:hypothetical protein LXA43DRAFT_899280 [Ganoderma leucocontextum]